MSLQQSVFPTNLIFASIWVFLISLSGCSNNNTGEAANNEDNGELYISLTDAAGDFTQYRVDVTALKLYKANGSIIETLPNTTTIDFTQYIDVTEFLSTSTIPTGIYTKAEMTLDFSDAQLSVENSLGKSIPAYAVDEQNKPLSSVTLTTFINASQGFTIKKGQVASLTIDFDLESSNEVTLADTDDSANVTVNPVLVANTSFDDNKERRLRGLLKSVDTKSNSYTVNIRPFQVRTQHFGTLTVNTNDATVYEINGTSFSADSGLNELANLDATAAIITLGTFDFDNKQFTAREVFAGSSVPWDNKDVAKGSIIARNTNSLTLLGATIERDDGRFTFNDKVIVNINNETKVTKQGSSDSVSIDDLSIGQRVLIVGDVLDDGTIDATTDGIVRMRYSDISGTVTLTSPLQINLQHINRRQVSQFDFSGTGTDPANDADPKQYEVATAALPLDNLNLGSALKVRGFPNAFASAPEDFIAKSIMDVSQVNTKMFINYGISGSATAVVSLDSNGLQLDIESATGRHHLNQFGVITDLKELASVPFISASNDSKTLFTINQGKTLNVYTQWSDFQQALSQKLENGYNISLLHSNGIYHADELTFSSRHLVVRLVPAF